MVERIRDFKLYVAFVSLWGGGYWMNIWTKAQAARLKTFPAHGHKYGVAVNDAFTLHGWYPFLRENRWNAWRQVYNMLYRYFVPVGLLYYEEPQDALHGVELPIMPTTHWIVTTEKWSPALVQAVTLSKLEEKYNKRLNFSNFKWDWKVVLILGIVIVVILLLVTGRFSL